MAVKKFIELYDENGEVKNIMHLLLLKVVLHVKVSI